jgi:hypothetical protein
MLFNDFKHLDVHKGCGDVKKRKTLNDVRPKWRIGFHSGLLEARPVSYLEPVNFSNSLSSSAFPIAAPDAVLSKMHHLFASG